MDNPNRYTWTKNYMISDNSGDFVDLESYKDLLNRYKEMIILIETLNK